MMDFSSHAGAATNSDCIPNGQLAFAILDVKGVKSSASGGEYIDCELTICEGQPFAKRKVFESIGNPFHQGNSEAYRQMGMVAITRILECAGAGPNNPGGYKLDDFRQLSGKKVAIKIKIEEGSGGHDDKNRVGEWLTPNPASKSGYKFYEKLMKGEYNSASQQQNISVPANGFGGAPTVGATGQGNSGGGFGNGSSAGFGSQQQPQQSSGFGGGNSGPGFQAPLTGSSGQSEASGATSADSTSSITGAGASPSNGEAAPGWLAQAGAAPQ